MSYCRRSGIASCSTVYCGFTNRTRRWATLRLITRCLRERLRNSAQRQYFLLILKTHKKRLMETVMSTISTRPASSEAFASNSWTFRPAAVLKRWRVAYLNWRLRQAAIAELAVLSDRELKDIGLKRGEIENAVTNTLKRECAFNR